MWNGNATDTPLGKSTWNKSQSMVQFVEIIENLSAVLLVEPYKEKLQIVIQNNPDYAKKEELKNILDGKDVSTQSAISPLLAPLYKFEVPLYRYWENFLLHGSCYFPKETICDCWAFEISCYFLLEYVLKEIKFHENI